MAVIRSIFAASVFVSGTTVVASAIIAGKVLGLPRGFIDYFTRGFGYTILGATLARVEYVVFKSDPGAWPERVVLVSNHESHLDGPGVQTTLKKRSIRYVAKQSLFKIPLLGWGLRAAGNVPVSRSGAKEDRERLSEKSAREKDGDVLFFAEGTRSRAGSFQAFKKGAFFFAIEHQRPIVPIAVCGGYEVMPAESLSPKGGNLAVIVGEPIDVTGYTLEEVDSLRDRVHARVKDLREEALGLVSSPRLSDMKHAGPVTPVEGTPSASFSV